MLKGKKRKELSRPTYLEGQKNHTPVRILENSIQSKETTFSKNSIKESIDQGFLSSQGVLQILRLWKICLKHTRT